MLIKEVSVLKMSPRFFIEEGFVSRVPYQTGVGITEVFILERRPF